MVNNKVHSAIKVSLFMANYGRELRMGIDIRIKSRKDNGVYGKNEKVQEKVEITLRKA